MALNTDEFAGETPALAKEPDINAQISAAIASGDYDKALSLANATGADAGLIKQAETEKQKLETDKAEFAKTAGSILGGIVAGASAIAAVTDEKQAAEVQPAAPALALAERAENKQKAIEIAGELGMKEHGWVADALASEGKAKDAMAVSTDKEVETLVKKLESKNFETSIAPKHPFADLLKGENLVALSGGDNFTTGFFPGEPGGPKNDLNIPKKAPAIAEVLAV